MSDQQAPKRIYLQQYFDCSDDMVTWCKDKINDEDIEYILQSEYDKLKSENDKLRAENERLREGLRAIAELNTNYVMWYESTVKWMKNRAKIALEEVKE